LVASKLKTSTRTLRRKLELEGTSFRDLVDELRAQVAIRYVHDTDFTIEDVAFRLGFSDAAAFRHAFRRWTNSSPQEFRRAKTDNGPLSAKQAVSRPNGRRRCRSAPLLPSFWPDVVGCWPKRSCLDRSGLVTILGAGQLEDKPLWGGDPSIDRNIFG
jgi:AraC-like DNA-binding protein